MNNMSQIKAISKAYEIIAVLIQGVLAETANFERDNDRQVLKVLEELREHCDQYGRNRDEIQALNDRLAAGRYYLMGVAASEITVENTLEAFGWTRNGFERGGCLRGNM